MCSIVKRHLQRSQTQIYTTSTNIKTGRHVLVQSQIQYYRPQLQPGCGYHFLFASHVGLSICRTVHGSVVLFCLSPKWSDLLQIEIKMFLNGPSITPLHDMLKVETATSSTRKCQKFQNRTDVGALWNWQPRKQENLECRFTASTDDSIPVLGRVCSLCLALQIFLFSVFSRSPVP